MQLYLDLDFIEEGLGNRHLNLLISSFTVQQVSNKLAVVYVC